MPLGHDFAVFGRKVIAFDSMELHWPPGVSEHNLGL